MAEKSNFYTLKGYEKFSDHKVTHAMEDYLEMIVRLYNADESIRINSLAKRLNVRPSSASKMATNLKNQGFISFEKYGYIKLTKDGEILGNYLISRHNILNRFLCFINNSSDELEEVEKIEHFLSCKTIKNIEVFLDKYEKKDM